MGSCCFCYIGPQKEESDSIQETVTTFLQYDGKLQSTGDQLCACYLLLSWSASILGARQDCSITKLLNETVFMQVNLPISADTMEQLTESMMNALSSHYQILFFCRKV
jgi:hypothetical protein